MTPESVLQVGREAIMVIYLWLCPVVGVGLIVGLTVSIFQATTQISEPTLAFIPKLSRFFWPLCYLADG